MTMFKWLFGETSAAKKITDAAIATGDALVYTDEEKAEFQKRVMDLHLEMLKVTATESTAQSITRRLICVPVVYLWLLLIVIGVIAELFGHQPTTIGQAIETMSLPALASIGFYVGRHMIAARK